MTAPKMVMMERGSRYLASVSRADLLTAHESGRRAKEVLLR